MMRAPFFFCVVFFANFLLPASGQTPYAKDSLAIKAVIDSAKTLLEDRKIDEAFVLLEQADKMLDSYPDQNTSMYVFLYQYQGYGWHLRGQLTKALAFFEKSMVISRRQFPPGDIKLTTPLNNLAFFYKQAQDFKRSRENLEEALSIRLHHMPEAYETGQAWANLGTLEYEVGNYSKALEDYLKAESLYIRYSNPKAQVSLSVAYLNMANVYDEWGDYDRAIEYYRKSLGIRKTHMLPGDVRIGTCLSLMGNSYENKRDLPNAENSYREALRICTALAPNVDSSELANCYENLATLLSKQKNFPEAIQNQKQCLRIREKCDWLGAGRAADAMVLLAQMYVGVGKLDSAAQYAEQAKEIWQQSYKDFYPPSSLDGWLTLADIRIRQGALQGAWQLTEEAMLLNGKSSGEDLVREQQILLTRARICRARYRQSGHIPDLQPAIPLLRKILDSQAAQQLRFGRAGSRLTAANLLYPVAEEALGICTELYEITHDSSVIDLGFQFMEQTKSALLRLNANETQAVFSSQVSTVLLNEEAICKHQLTGVEEERMELLLGGTPLNDPEVLALDGRLFELNRTMDSLKTIIRQQYPAYFQVCYSTVTSSITDIQHDLSAKNQTLLSYFWGEQGIYLIGIQSQDAFLIRLPDRSDIEPAARQLLQELRVAKKESQTLISASRSLYDALIKPVAARLTPKLVVVSDGVLSYLPFEVLLRRQPDNPYRYHTFPYLMLEHAFSYAPSASIWKEMCRKEPSKKPARMLAAFAPFYEGHPSQLAYLPEADTLRRQTFDPLPYSGEEVYRIQKITDGDVFFRKTATLAQFESIAEQYRILHLATHGKANDRSGDLSYLAFLNALDTTRCDLLLARDLYNMHLNAELITLSACETGAGEMRRGEGIISLARAFILAGSKSIVTSLWAVNDASTQKLMVTFYANLKKGMTKDQALTAAKRSYLKNFSPAAHPYYWASFVALGDMRPLWR
ncbi:MAG TPA: CHAT domain-containing protein [Saprospiraceae bacterium]|nr:CHAT domain-containing protein [Saprospiraceae bacterium]